MGFNVTDKDLIYFYFEGIRQIEPDSIIDIGMFLERCGSVSRQTMGYEIPYDMELTAFAPEKSDHFPVYETVYNEILTDEDLPDKEYYCACLLRPEDLFSEEKISGIISWCKSHVKYLLTDLNGSWNKGLKRAGDLRSIHTEVREYALVIMSEEN